MCNPQIIKIKNKKKISTSNPPNNFAFQLHFERTMTLKCFCSGKQQNTKKKQKIVQKTQQFYPRPRMIEVLFIKD